MGKPTFDEAEKLAGAWQESLVQSKFKQETERDKALVIISGGALTVSFAFITSLLEHGTLVRLSWLVASWCMWVGVLILTLVAYTVSIRSYNTVIDALSVGDWAKAQKRPLLAHVVEPLNITMAALTVGGFIAFGYFAVGVLQERDRDQRQPASHTSNDPSGQHTPKAPARPADASKQAPTSSTP